MKSLLQNSPLIPLLAAALLLSPSQAHTETFRGVIIDVDREQGRMWVTPKQSKEELRSPVLVQYPTEDPSCDQCKKGHPQKICKGKPITITGSFSGKQPELFIATAVFPASKAHFKDGTGVRLRLGRCRRSGKGHGDQPSF